MKEKCIAYFSRSNLFGWPSTIRKTGNTYEPSKNGVAYVTLADVLTDQGSTDAHFAGYSCPEHPFRLNTGAERLVAGGVQMVLWTFEVDCPKTLRVEGAAPTAWREQEREKIDRLLVDEPGVYIFFSRGGYRLLAWLPEPVSIVDGITAKEWADSYVLFGAHLYQSFGILIDPKCSNWHRLQRAPFAVRDDGVREPGDFIGDPKNVGTWALNNFDETQAETVLRELAVTHRPWAQALNSLEAKPQDSTVFELAEVDLNLNIDGIVDAFSEPISKIGEGGGRHTLYMALSGVLLDRGVSGEKLPEIIGRISTKAGVDSPKETRDRIKAASTTVAKAASGEKYVKIGTLVEHYGSVVEVLDKVLPSKRSKAEEAILRYFSKTHSRQTIDENGADIVVFKYASDVEIAQHIIGTMHKGKTDVLHTRDEFWIYEDSLWRNLDSNIIEKLVHSLDGTPYGEKGVFKANHPRVIGTMRRVAAELSEPKFFDELPVGISFFNGFLKFDVKTLDVAFEDPSPQHRQTSSLRHRFNPDVVAERWNKFLEEIFSVDVDGKDKARFLQQFIGACLVGVAPQFQACAVLDGVGDNGKSVFLKVISELFPANSRASVPPQKFGNEYYAANLAVARLNVLSEMPKTDIENSETFKAVISGDATSGRQPHGKVFTFKPAAGHIFACNKLPGTSDQSHGFWKRFIPIPFNRKFKKEEMDTTLDKYIIDNEMSGVVNWAIVGALEVLENGGYIVPESSVEHLRKWQENSDQVALFSLEMLEKCFDGEDTTTMGEDLYEKFFEWSRKNGHKPMASNLFATRLANLGWIKNRTNKGSEWSLKIKGFNSKTLRVVPKPKQPTETKPKEEEDVPPKPTASEPEKK